MSNWRPVFQTKFRTNNPDGTAATRGNCMAACLASLLGKELSEVPAFEENFAGDWEGDLVNWLDSLGLELLTTWDQPSDEDERYFKITGRSPRGNWYHSCIWHRGQIVHDPYPDGGGAENILYWQYLAHNEGEGV